MKYAVGVTLYNPTDQQLERANKLSDLFDKVYLFDNSEPYYKIPRISSEENVVIITEGENMGLPYAYNKIIERCGDCDILCTLDQDSIFLKEDIEKLKLKVETCDAFEEIGIIAPYIDYGFGRHKAEDRIENKRWVITSGSFVNLDIIRKEKMKYDEAYFIDKFEIDLCESLLRKGYKVLMYHGASLHQRLGEDSGHHYPNHNLSRHYYLYRNRFYFNNKWHEGIKKCFLNIAQTLNHILMVLLYEDNKLRKIGILRKAYSDYKRGVTGKVVNYGGKV